MRLIFLSGLTVLCAACGSTGGATDSSTTSTSDASSLSESGSGPTDATDSEEGPDTSDGSTESTTTGGDPACEIPSGSPLSQVWELVHDDPGSENAVGPIAATPSGDLLTTGVFNMSGLGGDLSVLKLSGAGELLWSRTVGAPPQTGVQDIAVNDAGRIFILGSTLINDPSFGLTSQLFVGGLDDTGELAWSDDTPTSPPTPYTAGRTIAVAPEGSLIVAGQGGAVEGFLRKYDADGTILWTVGIMDTSPEDLAIAPGGEIYVAGANVDGSVVEKRDAMGALIWAAPGPGVGAPDNDGGGASAIELDSMGQPIVSGIDTYLVGSPIMPTDSWNRLWVQWLDNSGGVLNQVEFDHTDFAQMEMVTDAAGRAIVAHRQLDGPPFVRIVAPTGQLVAEGGLACPGAGLWMTRIDDDLAFAGSVTAADTTSDAYVTRVALD